MHLKRTGSSHNIGDLEISFRVPKLVKIPFMVTMWILLASIVKIGFHLSSTFSELFPDSSLLIMVGLAVGVFLSLVHVDSDMFSLDSHIFFLYLLPPIVFDAGYFMPSRAFFDNLGSILVFAVIGTIWNVLTIGVSLWLISLTNLFTIDTPLLHLLLFSSLISAVDPVAVIVVFEEIHVNEMLYITVLGESLLNDAVTVVLYEMFKSFSAIGFKNLIFVDYLSGFFSFFVVAIGGVFIGLIWALIVSFTTRFTKHVKILNPVFIFLMPYCAYLTAELFSLSAIMAIVFCGIAMKQYVKTNISTKAAVAIKYFTKMLVSSSETVIFMFLGLSTVSRRHHWDTAFVALTLLFCLVYRSLGVVIQSFFLNKIRLVRFSKVDQFVMAYGGLRGAIAYGLVVAMPQSIPGKDMYITATIVVIYFTVFLQGMTIKPLVNFLKVEKSDDHEKTMTEYIFERLIDHTMAGIEDICGHRGHHWLRDTFETFNAEYLKPHLIRKAIIKPKDSKLVRAYTKITMKEAIDEAIRGQASVQNLQALNVKTTDQNGRIEVENAYSNPVFEDDNRNSQTEQPRRWSMDYLGIPSLVPKRLHLYSRHQDNDIESSSSDLWKLNQTRVANSVENVPRKSLDPRMTHSSGRCRSFSLSAPSKTRNLKKLDTIEEKKIGNSTLQCGHQLLNAVNNCCTI